MSPSRADSPSRRIVVAFSRGLPRSPPVRSSVTPRRCSRKRRRRCKIGCLNSFSKVFAALGNANLNGMNLYFEQIGGSIAGRKIEIIREDDEINPQVGLHKLKKLVESDKCDLITGIQASNVALAAVDYLRQSGTFFLCSGAGVTALGYVNAPNIFRCSISSQQVNAGLGDWWYDNGAKEVVTSASDFAGGRDTMAEFRNALREEGRQDHQGDLPAARQQRLQRVPRRHPLAQSAGHVQLLCGHGRGPLREAVRRVRAQGQDEARPARASWSRADVLPAQGKDALGIISSLHYADTLDNAENRKFVADYRAKYNEYPSVYSEYGYVAARCMHEALRPVDGNTQDKDKLRAAMLAVKFNAPRGPFRFNPITQSPIHNIYIREVAESRRPGRPTR